MSSFLPAEPAELAECVTEAAARRTPLSITGLGSKAALGRPTKNAGRLDLSHLDGVTFYESGELVFSALAGTPIETIETMLAENGQELAFSQARRRFHRWPSSPKDGLEFIEFGKHHVGVAGPVNRPSSIPFGPRCAIRHIRATKPIRATFWPEPLRR